MELITIKEVSDFLKVKKTTIYSWKRKGVIPSYKVNGLLRFDMDEIRDFVKQSKISPCNVMKRIKKPGILGIDSIIKKAVEDVKGAGYNPSNGKPDPSQGLRKEV